MEEKHICKYCKRKLIKFKNENEITERKYHKKCKELAKDDMKGLCFLINNMFDDLEPSKN